jgi:hypothetical protein
MTGRAVYTVGLAGPAQRAGVVAVRRAAFRRATEFDWKDEALLAWGPVDDESTVIALADATGRVLSTVRATVFAGIGQAEHFLEYSLGGMGVEAPVQVLSRAATHPEVARQGFNSVVRYAYLAAAALAPVACVVTLVYDGGPRLRSMREAGFDLIEPRAGWDTEAVARTRPLMAVMPKARIERALHTIAQAIAPTLAEAAVDGEGIAQGLRAQCLRWHAHPVAAG